MVFYPEFSTSGESKKQGLRVNVVDREGMSMVHVALDWGVEDGRVQAVDGLGCVLRGEVEITIGDEKRCCWVGDAFHVPGGVFHSFKPLSPGGVEYLEVFGPGQESGPGRED